MAPGPPAASRWPGGHFLLKGRPPRLLLRPRGCGGIRSCRQTGRKQPSAYHPPQLTKLFPQFFQMFNLKFLETFFA